GEHKGIKGIMVFTNEDSKIEVDIDMTNGLTNTSGKYPYHIHVSPINSTGSCDSTGGAAVPGYVCNSTTPEKCEAGDLSGKHGALQGTPNGAVSVKYFDDFISLKDNKTGIIGHSIVIHDTYTRCPYVKQIPGRGSLPIYIGIKIT
ncbi:10218_t:CDS:2, partial [Racocetra fulgida]